MIEIYLILVAFGALLLVGRVLLKGFYLAVEALRANMDQTQRAIAVLRNKEKILDRVFMAYISLVGIYFLLIIVVLSTYLAPTFL